MKRFSLPKMTFLKKTFLFINSSNFSENNKNLGQDDKFWEEYTKRKSEQKELQTLDTQFLRKTAYDFKYATSNFIKPEEFIECIENLNRNTKANFVIVDLRNEYEILEFSLPSRTKNLAYLPLIYREAQEVTKFNIDDFPKDKYIILVDSHENYSRKVSFFLYSEGYKVIYLLGGIINLRNILKDKKL